MGKLDLFEINFEPGQGVFFAGSVVRGTIVIVLKDAMKMRGLRMTCLGRAYVYWKEVENVGHKGGRQRVEAVENTAEEEYFNFRFPIWPQDGSTLEDQMLGAGQHTFPFQFQLASDLPPSFEGNYGYIRYWTKATIDKPWKADHHTKRAFTIIPPFDLNLTPGIADPIQYRGEIRTGCCCLPSGRFSGAIATNGRGFVPGNDVVLTVSVDNHTSSTCFAEAKIRMNITYLTGRKYKQEKKTVVTAYKEQIPRGKDYIWKEKLQIPPLPPSHLKGCKIIKFQYILQFNVGSDAKCSWDEIEFEDEIIIGTKPLVVTYTPNTMAKQAASGASGSVAEQQISELEGQPRYQECSLFASVSIKDKDDTEQTLGELIFTPLYAFYKKQSQPI